jgi:hypothetical protein
LDYDDLGDFMALDLITVVSVLILALSTAIFLYLAYTLYFKKERNSLVTNFAMGIISAAISTLLAAIFLASYIILPDEPLSWALGSYLYYFFIVIALGFVLSTSIQIMMGSAGRKYGYVSFIVLIPVTLAYLLEYVFQTPGVPDMSSTIEGTILLYGSVGLQLLITVFLYYRVYRVAPMTSTKLMLGGMLVILLGGILGAIADSLGGDIGHFFDPVGFFTVLIGIYFVYAGFTRRPETEE